MATFESALSAMKNGGKARRDGWDKGSLMYADEHGQFMRTPQDQGLIQRPYSWILDMKDVTATDWSIVEA